MKRLLILTVTVLALASAMCDAALAKESTRIAARPVTPSEACVPGLHALGLESGRDGLLFVPAAVSTNKKMALVVFLHGAGHDSQEAMEAMRSEAESQGFLLLAPDSRGTSWDAIRDSFGPDVQFLNRALVQVFRQCAVDSGHITLAGFSDGASYALSLGLANGDLFSRIIALSPGFIIPAGRHGKPSIFLAHGTRDRILPIDRASRSIRRDLESAGYEVQYREFDGPHAMSRTIIAQALRWAR